MLHQWLDQKEKNRISHMLATLNGTKNIILTLCLKNPFEHYEIVYRKSGIGTVIEFESDNKNELFDGSFVKNFNDDFGELLKNHKRCFSILSTYVKSWDDSDYQDAILENLCEVLKSRRQALQVNRIDLRTSNVTFATSLIKRLDPKKLESIRLYIDRNTSDVGIESLEELVGWNEGSRLNLEIFLEYVELYEMENVKELLRHTSTFRKITINYPQGYNTTVYELFAAYKPTKVKKDNENYIEFDMENEESIELDHVSETKTETSFLEVFVNPIMMNVVLKELECFDIQRLRKVSHGIRECIDYIKPDPHIDMYEISLRYGDFNIAIDVKNENISDIAYRELEPGKCLVRYRKENVFECEDLQSIVFHDFRINLMHQKTSMKELCLFCAHASRFEILHILQDFLKSLGKVLKSRSAPLRVESLRMVTVDQSGVMEILPYLDAKSIKAIQFWRNKKQRFKDRVRVDEICQLEQWKNAVFLVMNELVISTVIQEMNILHFEEAFIRVQTISSDDMFYLKENLRKSSNFKKFIIYYVRTTIDESLYNVMGFPFQIFGEQRTVWYFPMTNSAKFLNIVHNKKKRAVQLMAVASDRVPEVFLEIN